jgi:alpha-L-fucosidase 2
MHPINLKLSFILFGYLLVCSSPVKAEKLTIWYDKPASVWNEALPVGNGRLGAMIFGDPAQEKLQLNENTFWSGGPSRNDNPDAIKVLSQVRQLIFDEKYQEAEKLVNQNIRAKTLQNIQIITENWIWSVQYLPQAIVLMA